MFGKSTTDFVINSQDLLLQAINNAKRWAQSQHDFELCRQSVQVTVSATTGALLSTATEVEATSLVPIKKIEAAYLTYTNGQRPVGFVSKKFQTSDLRRKYENLPYDPTHETNLTAGSSVTGVTTMPYIVQHGPRIFLYPDTSNVFTSGSTTVYLDVVRWLADYGTGDIDASGATNPTLVNDSDFVRMGEYLGLSFYQNSSGYKLWGYNAAGVITWYITGTAADFLSLSATNKFSLVAQTPIGTWTNNGTYTGTTVTVASSTSTNDFFLDYGSEFLFWRAIVEGNYKWKEFVNRTEGNLPPPDRPAAEAFAALKVWDGTMTTQNSTAFDLE